jgi:hypothetical protein
MNIFLMFSNNFYKKYEQFPKNHEQKFWNKIVFFLLKKEK